MEELGLSVETTNIFAELQRILLDDLIFFSVVNLKGSIKSALNKAFYLDGVIIGEHENSVRAAVDDSEEIARKIGEIFPSMTGEGGKIPESVIDDEMLFL